MMESWPGRQGQYYHYSKFGTVPGRNCTHNYQERHQTPHYPVYYDELQQNRSRESSHWTAPGSRAGAALHEHTNWTDADLIFPSTSPSSHFPFTLDRHPHHHHDVQGYQTHEVPDWTAPQPSTRDHDKGLLREEWQKKWDLSNQVSCNRDTLGTRSESNYRELEAWATRYRHSLPRRRRIEAELRGASQRTVDNSRTDHQETTMQHTKKNPISREFGLYPLKAPTSNTSHMMGMKENTQRMMFSQPPGYNAPPPYNSQHKVSPVYHYCASNWEKDGKRPVSGPWSHFSLRLHDGPADNRTGEKEGFKMSESQSNTKLKGLKAQREDVNTLQTGSPISVLNTQRRLEHMLPLQYSSEKPKTIGETSSRVIEGRKFKLEKKTGGMTIFCLVSRMAANTETPSLLYSKTNPESAETEYVPQTPRLREDNTPAHKLADEVDFTASTLIEQTKVSDMRNLPDGQKETPTPTNEKQEVEVLSSKACAQNEPEIILKNECEQPASTKYPLWREPRSTSRTEKVNKDVSDGGEHVCVQEVSQPVDSEVSKHDIKEKADDKMDLLVIDTTCVLVKMELIQSPNKEHVLYLGSPGGDHHILLDDQTTESKCPLREPTGEDTHTNPSPETNNNPTSPGQEEHIKEENEENVMSSPESESETFEERAERILGIPLDLCTKKLEAEDLIAVNDLKAKNEGASSTQQRTTEEEQSQGHQQVVQSNKPVSLTENDHRGEMTGNDGENALASHSKGAQSSGEKETSMDLTHPEMTDHSVLESPCDNNNYVENDGEHQTVEDVEECAEMAPLVTAESFFLPQLTSPETVDCSSVSTSHADTDSSTSSSSPPLDSNSQSAKVLCDTESQDKELITDSVDLNKTKVFSISMQQLNDCQPDDAVSDLFQPQSEADGEHKEALKEHFGAAEEEPFSAITLQQLLESVNVEADDEPKTSDTTEQQSPTEGFQDSLGILSHCTKYGEKEKECEIEVKTCEEKAGNTTANVQSQENHEELLTSHEASTEAQNNTTDAEHSLDLSALDCEEPQPTSDELTCPELVSHDSVSFLDSAPAAPPNPGPACDVPQKDTSLLCEPLHVSVTDQVFCSTSPDEEHTCQDEAHKVHLQHPQSLRDVVSRIRKHTAPDSENEEEEVSEPWDPESLDPALLFTDGLMDCSESVDEDRLSCSSISSHSSGDTVIVAEETAECAGEPSEVQTEIERLNKPEDLCSCGENTAEDKQEDNKPTDMSESSPSEECYNKATGEHEKTET